MTDGPVAQSSYRVPRSRVDDLYVMAEPLPSISIGAAQIVSVEGETATVMIGDETITGVVFLGDPPEVGDYVEIESRDDLTVIPDDPGSDPDTFIEGISTTSAHIVSEDDPGSMPDVDINVAGSMRDLSSWVFLAPSDPAWQRDLDATGTGLEVTHDGSVASGAGTLWSMLPFDVLPGDVLGLTFTGSWLALSTVTVVPVVAYSPIPAAGEDPLPGSGTQVITVPPGVLVNTTGEILAVDITVPEQITTVTDGDVVPTRARLGYQLTITAPASAPDVDLLLAETQLVKSSMDWPIGSVWFDPDANTGGLVTVGQAPQESATSVTLPNETTFSRSPGFRKVVFAAPSDTGGVIMLWAMGGIAGASSSTSPVDFRINTDLPGGHNFPFARFDLISGVNVGFTVMGNVEVAPGDQGEIWVEYRYVGSSADLAAVRLGCLMPVFFPAAVRPDDTSDPMTRYWDGDSWRPPVLHGASMDMTDEGTVVGPAKIPTTTTTTRTPSSLNPGDKVTITASVSPSGADGTVSFYVGPSATGPWTGLGSTTLTTANTATKTYVPSKTGTVYFLGKYVGSTTHAVSQDATSATTVANPLRTVTRTLNATYVQAYGGADNQIASGPNPDGIQQGYFGPVTGHHKSLIGFNVALPGDAEVKKVELVCHGWTHWEQASNTGSVRLGWHSRSTKPTTWTIGTGDAAKTTHSVDQGGWRVGITSWADTAVKRSDFWGIAVGPGASDGNLYQGYSAEGTDEWDLVITYTTRT